MLGQSAAMLFALATMASAVDKDVASINHQQLSVGQQFEIHCADRVFRCELIDGSTGRCQMAVSSDGENFHFPANHLLAGRHGRDAAGPTLVLMREVKVGLKMELGIGDLDEKNRLITGEVTAIRLIE